MLNRLAALLFPPKCIFCGRLIKSDGSGVCASCQDEIELDVKSGKRGGLFYETAVTALEYDGKVRKALHRFKFSGKQSYAAPLARILAFAVRQKLNDIDVITFVPTNAANLRRRGYDHARLMAKVLSSELGLPFIAALEKTRKTKPMFGLGRAERRANVLGAFKLGCRNEDIAGKNVLIVDDVITTGATVSECAGILKSGGAGRVYCVAVASVKDRARDGK